MEQDDEVEVLDVSDKLEHKKHIPKPKKKRVPPDKAILNILISKKENELLEHLAIVLKERGVIKHATKAEAARYCIWFTANYVAKLIEMERGGAGGGKAGEGK